VVAASVRAAAVLGYFKYADFAWSIIEGRQPHAPEVPLALSFTTFVQIAFLVEVWRRPAAVALRNYGLRHLLSPPDRSADRALGGLGPPPVSGETPAYFLVALSDRVSVPHLAGERR
jgi:hypothetical protein